MLVGKPGLDGHSNGAEQIAVRSRDIGIEVVYEGIRSTPEQLVVAAIEEGVHIIGLSILSGSHVHLVKVILDLLKKNNYRGVPHSASFGPGFMATLQVIGALTPDSEIERLYVDLKADLYNGTSNIDSKGNISIPNGPGLGMEPNLEIIEKYSLI